MDKARSRLQPGYHQSSDSKPSPTTTPSVTPSHSEHHPRRQNLSAPVTLVSLKKYLYHLPTLLIAAVGWVGLIFILTQVEPQQIRHLPLPESYVPLLLSCWLAVSFTAAFVLLSTRRGILLGLLITLWLSFKLQAITLDWWQWLCLISILVLFEVFTTLKRRASPPTSTH